MQFEANQQGGAEKYKRSSTRVATRNESKPRTTLTKIGKLTLQKPRFRDKSFETVVFERYRYSRQSWAVEKINSTGKKVMGNLRNLSVPKNIMRILGSCLLHQISRC